MALLISSVAAWTETPPLRLSVIVLFWIIACTFVGSDGSPISSIPHVPFRCTMLSSSTNPVPCSPAVLFFSIVHLSNVILLLLVEKTPTDPL